MESPVQRQALCLTLGTQSLARQPLGGGQAAGLEPGAWVVQEPACGKKQGWFQDPGMMPSLLRHPVPLSQPSSSLDYSSYPRGIQALAKLILQMATE